MKTYFSTETIILKSYSSGKFTGETVHEDIHIILHEKFTLKILILMKISLVKHIIDQSWINKIFLKWIAKHNSLYVN